MRYGRGTLSPSRGHFLLGKTVPMGQNPRKICPPDSVSKLMLCLREGECSIQNMIYYVIIMNVHPVLTSGCIISFGE